MLLRFSLGAETILIRHRGDSSEAVGYLEENSQIACIVINPTVVQSEVVCFGRTPFRESFARSVKRLINNARKEGRDVDVFVLVSKRTHHSEIPSIVKSYGLSDDQLEGKVFDLESDIELEQLLEAIRNSLFPQTPDGLGRIKLSLSLIRDTFVESIESREAINRFLQQEKQVAFDSVPSQESLWKPSGTAKRRTFVPLVSGGEGATSGLLALSNELQSWGVLPFSWPRDPNQPQSSPDAKMVIASDDVGDVYAGENQLPNIDPHPRQRRLLLATSMLTNSSLRRIQPQIAWCCGGDEDDPEEFAEDLESSLRRFVDEGEAEDENGGLAAGVRLPETIGGEEELRAIVDIGNFYEFVFRDVDSIVGTAKSWRKINAFRQTVSVGMRDKVRYVLLTAIPEELEAALRSEQIDSFVAIRDEESYLVSLKTEDGSPVPIILSCIGEAGRVPASLSATTVIAKYQPEYLVLSGIAGSFGPTLDDDTPLGDLVISERVIDYEPGKMRGKRLQARWVGFDCDLKDDMIQFRKSRWEGRPVATRAAESARQRARAIFLRQAISERIDVTVKELTGEMIDEWSDDREIEQRGRELWEDRGELAQLHQGTVLSGDKVVASKEYKKELMKHLSPSDKRTLRGVEMEAGGVIRSIRAITAGAGVSRPQFGMIRGICDDATEGKDDDWHEIAADLAAVFGLEFIRWHASTKV